MKYCKLRIAWSVACDVAGVLVVALWVRSYENVEIVSPWSDHWVSSSHGELLIDVWRPSNQLDVWEARRGAGYTVPFWLPAALFGVAGAFPLFHWRFSLRSLLIAMTVAAIGLGSLVYTLRR